MNEREPSVLPPGTELAGKYRIEENLGSGAMAVVVAATHLGLGQRVAIKFLRPERRAVPAAAERFLREARAASMLRSEHVARVFDTGTTDGGLVYMVMEYLEGEDLRRYLERHGPLSATEAIGYVLQACEGLAEVHRAGFVHRDIKPSNLFRLRGLDGTALIKLLDFGLTKTACARDRVITSGALVLGSPAYMAPEQLLSAHDVDARADIWSLGVVLYELLTNVAPPAGSLSMMADTLVQQATPVPSHVRADLPPALDPVILRCLRRNPDERWPNVAAFAMALSCWAPLEQRETAERCVRILRESTRPGVPIGPPPDSWPGMAYDRPPGSTKPPAGEGVSRWGAIGGVSAATALILVLICWMVQLGSRGEGSTQRTQPVLAASASSGSSAEMPAQQLPRPREATPPEATPPEATSPETTSPETTSPETTSPETTAPAAVTSPETSAAPAESTEPVQGAPALRSQDLDEESFVRDGADRAAAPAGS